MITIYIRNSVRSNQTSDVQYNVPLRYSGVTVASPPVHKNVMQARSGSARLSMDASGVSDMGTDVSGEDVHTDSAAGESVQSDDGAVRAAPFTEILSDSDTSDVAEDEVYADTAVDDTSENMQPADTDGKSAPITDVFGLFKRAPLEAVPNGYDCRGNPRIPDSRGLADFAVLSGTGAGELPTHVRDDTADSVPDGGISGGISGESADVRSGNFERYNGEVLVGDTVNLLKNLAVSVDSDDLLITALILMMLAERSADGEAAADDYLLLILAFLLLSGNR